MLYLPCLWRRYALGLGLSSEARARLADFKPHVAHFTVCDLLGMDGISWCKANGVAMVGTWHSNYCEYVKFYSGAWWLTPVLRRYIQQFYGAFATTFVPTDYMRIKLSAEGYDRFTDMQIWGRGIDLDRFNPATRRSEAFRRRVCGVGQRADGQEELVIIWTGRLVPEKRPDIWKDVVTALMKEGHPVLGLVVGVGPEQASLEGIPGITVCGWLSGLDLAEAYASADILLFPSDVETFGNVTLEGLGSGIPAVVEGSCSRHLVTDGVEGFTVHQEIDDPSDKAAYTACVERYLDKTRRLVVDPALRKQCGANALKKAAQFSNTAVQTRMIDNYEAAHASLVAAAQAEVSDPNDKALGHGGRRGHTSRVMLLCCWWRSARAVKTFTKDAAHVLFQWLARIVIFMLWLLLGLPHVTSTNLADTNVRHAGDADHVTRIEV